ncbi:MAG: nitrate ABC transporter, permease protein, partial [Polaromonas sp.]|nr:nitrate ABC transporter, permease protein [Polaromonas sp.]
MVSAVFHSPLEPLVAPAAAQQVAAAAPADTSTPSQRDKEKASTPFDWRGAWMAFLPPLLGLGLLVGIWEMVSVGTARSIPSPLETWKQALVLFSDPFYSKGPNDQGVGWNVLSSLQRVAFGFGMAALVGIPVGFMIGRFEFLSRMFNPLISLMRPVSPLAWLPIGLLVFKGANPAAIWTIFI